MVHGLSIPLGKLGFYLPRTISSALDTSSPDEPEPFHIADGIQRGQQHNRQRHQQNQLQLGRRPAEGPPRAVFRIGRSVIRGRASQAGTPQVVSPRATSPAESPSSPNSTPLNNLEHSQISQRNRLPVDEANGSIVKRTLTNGDGKNPGD